MTNRTGSSIARLLAAGLTFLQSCRTASELAQIEELGAADLAGLHDFDLRDIGREERKRSLDTDPLGDFPNAECLPRPFAAFLNDRALEYLDTFLVAFFDLHVNPHKITGIEFHRGFGLSLQPEAGSISLRLAPRFLRQ